MPNTELAYKVLDHIDAHPESWNQSSWSNGCGTVACFAGWAVMLSGYVIEHDDDVDDDEPVVCFDSHGATYISDAAAALLDIGLADAMDLFKTRNDRAALGELVEAAFGPRPEVAS